jgi:hypothetical protein
MLKPPPVPDLCEMQVAWVLLRVCPNDPRFVHYSKGEQAEVIRFFRYVDPEPNGPEVLEARELLEAAWWGQAGHRKGT